MKTKKLKKRNGKVNEEKKRCGKRQIIGSEKERK